MKDNQDGPAQVVVMASGDGGNLEALLAACEGGGLAARVIALAADKKCPAVHVAEAAGLPIIFHPWGHYRMAGKLASTYDRDLAVKILLRAADYVVLDGWTRPLSASFFEHFPQRTVYLHHALTGLFPGTNAVDDALEAYQRGDITRTGVKVLFTSGGDVESDPLIRQAEVPLRPDDTPETLWARLRPTGRETLIDALRALVGIEN
jgi:phosphoribosylglycinamide formyltransferase-1